MILDKAALLSRDDLKHTTVEIGPLNGEVRLRELSVAERLGVYKRIAGADENDPEQAMRGMLGIVAVSLCNDDDTPMFPTIEAQDEAVEGLMQISNAAVEELMTAVQKHNGMEKDATKDAVGNSDASLSVTSSSGSPATSDTQTSDSSAAA